MIQSVHKESRLPVHGAAERIAQSLATWEGVESGSHRFGGTEYRVGTREIGHIHGDYLVDIPFPKRIRDQIVAAGEANPHHILPESGWVSLYIREESDITRAIDLLQRSYRIAIQQRDARSDG